MRLGRAHADLAFAGDAGVLPAPLHAEADQLLHVGEWAGGDVSGAGVRREWGGWAVSGHGITVSGMGRKAGEGQAAARRGAMVSSQRGASTSTPARIQCTS